MMLFIGLGNPGKKYQRTWHSIGFLVIDEFQKENNFPDFSLSKKFNTLISEGKINNEKIVLAKPQTYMNESGKTVEKLIKNSKSTPWKVRLGFGPKTSLKIENLIVVHDDIDLPLGKIKISKGKGSAGHKGVESIIKEIGSKNFIRLRLGIAPKQSHSPSHRTEKAGEIVLKKFDKEEKEATEEMIKKASKAIGKLITLGLEKTMNEYNQ